jgi:hypothetical protein
MSKREWWEDIKAKLSPSPRVASQATVISRGDTMDIGHGTTNEPAPAGEGDPWMFFSGSIEPGQLMKLSAAGRAARGPKDYGLNSNTRARLVKLRGACLTLEVNSSIDTWHPSFWEPA